VKKIRVKYLRAFLSGEAIPINAKYIRSERIQEGFLRAQEGLVGKTQILDSMALYDYYEIELDIMVDDVEFEQMKKIGF
jgi:hypothetical protein